MSRRLGSSPLEIVNAGVTKRMVIVGVVDADEDTAENLGKGLRGREGGRYAHKLRNLLGGR